MLDCHQSIKLVLYCLSIQNFTLGIPWVPYALVHNNWSLRQDTEGFSENEGWGMVSECSGRLHTIFMLLMNDELD